jgi:cytosine deaminase
MLIDRLTDARVSGRAGLCAIAIAGGRCAAIEATDAAQAAPTTSASGATLEAEGRVVVPALVDAHVHLDKAFLLHEAESAGALEPTLPGAIASVAALRKTLATGVAKAGAERAVHRLVKHGVTAARVHVEIEPSVGLDLVHMHDALAVASADRIALQLVAFPQLGLEHPAMVDLMTRAMALGFHVVGGCPYVDADPRRHLDVVFSLAERFAVPVDLHLDFSDDPGKSLLGLVCERTRAHGMAGRVTLGHVTTLAAMSSDAQAAALDRLAECGIAVVVLPATDLYLAGHGEPGTRSLAPWERAAARGVRVAIANNNVCNPFAPFGNGNLLQAAWLAGIARRASTPASRATLFEAVTSAPARILGLEPHGPVAGAAAHLAVLDAIDPDEVVLEAPAVVATLRAGRLVSRLSGPRVATASAARSDRAG